MVDLDDPRNFSVYLAARHEVTLERDKQEFRKISEEMSSMAYPVLLYLAVGCGVYILYSMTTQKFEPAIVVAAATAAICSYRIIQYRGLKRQAERLEKKWADSGVRLTP